MRGDWAAREGSKVSGGMWLFKMEVTRADEGKVGRGAVLCEGKDEVIW